MSTKLQSNTIILWVLKNSCEYLSTIQPTLLFRREIFPPQRAHDRSPQEWHWFPKPSANFVLWQTSQTGSWSLNTGCTTTCFSSVLFFEDDTSKFWMSLCRPLHEKHSNMWRQNSHLNHRKFWYSNIFDLCSKSSPKTRTVHTTAAQIVHHWD